MHGSARNPSLLNLDELLEAFKHLLRVVLWEPKLSVRAVHTLEVLVRAVKHGAIVVSDVCLHALEALDGVVKGGIRWVELKWLVLLNRGLLPTSIVHIIVDLEHVVGSETAEGVLVICSWLRLKNGPLFEGEL